MVSTQTIQELAASFEGVIEAPHFEKLSYRVRNKIFATLDVQKEQLVIKLNAIDQSVFCAFDRTVMYPVNGAWGKQGWTVVALKKVKKEMLVDALSVAYATVAGKK